MKTTITFFLTLVFSISLIGQSSPDCSNLKVENIQMDDDTANLMKVTIRNNCSNCASGLNGCVYSELTVIKTVSALDTIASSKCLCLWSPNNNSQRTYLINSTVATLPPLNSIRVSFMNCGCDAIVFNLSTGIPKNTAEVTFDVFPNPFSSTTTLHIDSPLQNAVLTIYNCFGQLVKQMNGISGQTVLISRDDLASALYYFELTQDNKLIKADKLVITN